MIGGSRSSPACARAVIDLYAEIKRAGDSFLGVPTQCFVASKAGIGTGQAPRGRPQYCANIALKVPGGPPARSAACRAGVRRAGYCSQFPVNMCAVTAALVKAALRTRHGAGPSRMRRACAR